MRSVALVSIGLFVASCARAKTMTGDSRPPASSDAPPAATAPPSAASASPPAAGSPHAGYLAAREALEGCEKLRAQGDLERARGEAERALASLGTDYAPAGTMDDTTMKLHAAADLWKDGRRADALHGMVRTLRARLGLYAKKHPDAPAEPRRLELGVAAPSTRAGEPLKVTITLKNAGSVPVLVTSRLALNSSHAPDPFREIVFDVRGPDGKLIVFGPRIRIGFPEAKHVIELAPGKELTHDYELSRYFDLSAPGNYSVSALYESAPVADATGRPAWTELVYSPKVAFTRAP